MEAYKYLASLRAMLTTKREELKEKLATPMKDHDDRERIVGQCVAHQWTIDKLNEQIKSINGDTDDAAADPKPIPPPRPSYK